MSFWIESHQSLSRHRKTLAAAAALKISRHLMIGHLHELWWWGLDNADTSGHLGSVSDEVLAEAAGWPVKDARRFVQALMCAGGGGSAGFMETDENGGYVLHDWFDYAGKLNDQKDLRRSSNRAAQTRRRQRLLSSHVSNKMLTVIDDSKHFVTSDADANDDSQQSTGPNLTVNPPISPLGDGEDHARPTKPRRPKGEHHALTATDRSDLIAKYRDRYGSDEAVSDVIGDAMNHESRLTKLNERQYADGWLRRELERRPVRLATVQRDGDPHYPMPLDSTGERTRERWPAAT